MDKKLYFEPELKVVELNLAKTILVGSAGDDSSTGDNNGEIVDDKSEDAGDW
jgi:hypothetical protein